MIRGTGTRAGRILAWALAWVSGAFAQATWQTTHTSTGGWNGGACELMNAALRVTAHPAWLEVEEDFELAAVGAVDAGNDGKTLEIAGSFRLPPEAAITGALLWDGDKVLQARLLDKSKADSAYQSLVDRNSLPPPRPRDPILLELVSKGLYRLRIYPVEASRSRHVRLRYQLPPAIGAEGLEMTLQAAVGTLFPGSPIPVSVTFAGAGVGQMLLAMPDGSRATLDLPRTRLMRAADLQGAASGLDSWYGTPGTRLIPVDRARQVAVKTSIPSGLMQGNYLNLYAGVTDEVLGALGRKVEVAVLWKWHNPAAWTLEDRYGYVDYGYAYEAQAQAAALLDLYGQLGGPGNRVGLVHDDGKGEPKAFKAAARGEAAYQAALDYLGHVQGDYALDFARSMKPATRPAQGDVKSAVRASLGRFYQNLRILKTVYSPETGVVRHLILVSAGPENVTDDTQANAAFDSLFSGTPISVATLAGHPFAQAGFDAWAAHRDHPALGPQVATGFGNLPGFEALNLTVSVRNDERAIEFPIRCDGGLNLACGTLTFHGKSASPWKDSLEWEAFDAAGQRIGKAKTRPSTVGGPGDTSIAILWAGSESPFSENRKEPPLGPVYGFVDRWASLIGVPKDTLKAAKAYEDTGVPRVAPARLADVLPDYLPGQSPSDPNGGDPGDPTVALRARLGEFQDPSRWTVERIHGGFVLRVPGLQAGLDARLELFDLAGKRAGTWVSRSEAGGLRLSASLRPGIYLLQVSLAGARVSRRIAL